MFIVLLYTFYGKLSNAFISFQDSEKSEGLYEKELNLEPLILYLCRLYDCFAIFIRRLKQSPRLDINFADAIFIRRLKQSTGLF